MQLIFAAVVNVLLPICCHIGSGMPNLRIFVEDIVALLDAMTNKMVRKLVCGRNQKLSNDKVSLKKSPFLFVQVHFLKSNSF